MASRIFLFQHNKRSRGFLVLYACVPKGIMYVSHATSAL